MVPCHLPRQTGTLARASPLSLTSDLRQGQSRPRSLNDHQEGANYSCYCHIVILYFLLYIDIRILFYHVLQHFSTIYSNLSVARQVLLWLCPMLLRDSGNTSRVPGQLQATIVCNACGGFPCHGGTPIAGGWFIYFIENPNLKSMICRTPPFLRL